MKNLSIEQKAKRYDEAIKRAKSKIKNDKDHVLYEDDVIEIFPELKESEDERIRKELTDYIKSKFENSCSLTPPKNILGNWIAWLEKQEASNPYSGVSFEYNGHTWGMCARDNGVEILVDGTIKERVSLDDKANKVEPKFKKGDWIVFNGLTLLINKVVQGYYRTISKGGIPNSYDWDIDNAARLWTIKEARDGDVLACESGWTCIFKTLVNEETFGSYCFMDSTGWFCGLGSECHTLKEEFVKAYNGKIQPATKEQRDLFFKKMQESGYEWNAEKKVLKNLKPKFKVGDWIVSANGKVNQVISVDADNVDFDGYTLDDGVYFSGTWCNCYHLWTIKDAKEGDVLSYETDDGDLWIMVYWSLYEPYEGHIHYHALLVNDDFSDKGTCCICIDNLKPATIEQHELLFRKMKEKGYQWDKNKKELIKL